MERMIRHADMAESAQGANLSDTPDNRQIHFIVDGCKVKLHFLPEPDNKAVQDIKRMMLDGMKK